MRRPVDHARWIFPALGASALLTAWLVPPATLAEALRHPMRGDAVEAAARAASWARIGWSMGAITLACLPWVLLDARTGLEPPARVPVRWLWLAMLLAVVLRFSASTQGLWYDEIASLGTYVAHGPGVIVGNAFTTANHPLQSLLSWCCLPLGVEPWVRLPSMLCGAAAVLGCWWIGRATRNGTALAATMAFTVALLPAAVNAGSEARGYALMIAAASLSTGLLLMAHRHGGSWRWIAYALVLALGVWAHFVTAMVGFGHAAFACGLLRRKEMRVAGIGTLAAVACAALLALALWSPALPDLLRTRAQFAATRGDEPSLLGTQGLLLAWQLLGMTPLPMRGSSVDTVLAAMAAVAPACLLIAGLLAIARDRSARASLCLAGLGLPAAIALASLGGSWLYARFLLFAVPATVLLLALGAIALLGSLVRSGDARRIRPAAIVPALAAAAFLGFDAGAGARQPIREAVAFVAAERAPDQRVLGIGIADDVVQWYAMAHRVPIEPTGIGGDRIREALARTDADWIVALYPNHRHAEATGAALQALGFRRHPPHAFPGWLDAGEGTVEVWRRERPRP